MVENASPLPMAALTGRPRTADLGIAMEGSTWDRDRVRLPAAPAVRRATVHTNHPGGCLPGRVSRVGLHLGAISWGGSPVPSSLEAAPVDMQPPRSRSLACTISQYVQYLLQYIVCRTQDIWTPRPIWTPEMLGSREKTRWVLIELVRTSNFFHCWTWGLLAQHRAHNFLWFSKVPP